MEKPVNKYHAAFLRAKLNRGASEAMREILSRLTDEELIRKEREHHQFLLANGGRPAKQTR